MTDLDALLDRLRQVARDADPVPADLEASARAALGLGRLDDELAELLHDSAAEATGVRDGGGDAPRMLSFGNDIVGADVEIAAAGEAHDVTGVVSGPVTTVALQTPTALHHLALDAHGQFRVAGVTGAAMRLELRTDSGFTVVTPWVLVR